MRCKYLFHLLHVDVKLVSLVSDGWKIKAVMMDYLHSTLKIKITSEVESKVLRKVWGVKSLEKWKPIEIV